MQQYNKSLNKPADFLQYARKGHDKIIEGKFDDILNMKMIESAVEEEPVETY